METQTKVIRTGLIECKPTDLESVPNLPIEFERHVVEDNTETGGSLVVSYRLPENTELISLWKSAQWEKVPHK